MLEGCISILKTDNRKLASGRRCVCTQLPQQQLQRRHGPEGLPNAAALTVATTNFRKHTKQTPDFLHQLRLGVTNDCANPLGWMCICSWLVHKHPGDTAELLSLCSLQDIDLVGRSLHCPPQMTGTPASLKCREGGVECFIFFF